MVGDLPYLRLIILSPTAISPYMCSKFSPYLNNFSPPLIQSIVGAGISEEDQQRLFKEIIQFNPEKLQAGGGSGSFVTFFVTLLQCYCMSNA